MWLRNFSLLIHVKIIHFKRSKEKRFKEGGTTINTRRLPAFILEFDNSENPNKIYKLRAIFDMKFIEAQLTLQYLELTLGLQMDFFVPIKPAADKSAAGVLAFS